MRVFASGFNIFGQFADLERALIENFTETDYESADDIVLSHSFNLRRSGNRVFYDGAKNQRTRAILKFEIPNLAQVACSEHRILLLNRAGDIFKIDAKEIDTMKSLPNLIALEKDESVIKIETGSKITAALTNKGHIFNLPSKLEFSGINIIDLRVGREHCLLLDEKGCVYTFGNGSRGQLGHSNLEELEEPKLVDALSGIPIKEIAAGGWHSCAVSCSGDLYTWGWNGNGQLGLSRNSEKEAVSVMATPHVVDVLDDSNEQENIAKVACGTRHTVVLTDSNRLYGCGWNKYKQLGIPSDENVYQMKFLKCFKDYEVNCLKCGTWNSAVVCKMK